MTKVQSFPWAIEPISKSECENKVAKRTTESMVLEIEANLKQLPPEVSSLLLQPYIEESLSFHRAKLETCLAEQMQDKLESELQVRVDLAVAPLKKSIELEEGKRRYKVEQLVEHFMAPEIESTQIESEHVLALALTISEKILGQKVISKPCYNSWVDSILGTAQGHLMPTLSINQQDYDMLLEYDLIEKINKKVESIKVVEVANFSFEIESIRGQSGHDSLAILLQLQIWLNGQGNYSD
ncbi:hypothetical protein GCM10007978_01570 [Shewanella hanedai]|uniref:Uncharacterized protein n=1 Tax=Shewanella hanedai TaxID=25 RepID=A0A553JUZ3_SHEHA|nr:hypothetical protein [Shewanella hanedai]TRY16269.1 hypothetical protein FN961_01175 [Shewanella hanedai]GGI67597.1 hypothetical protein GCM10007978_01570 [Shewanella hanedai]